VRASELSKKSTVFEVVLDDDVRDGVEDELDVVGVSGAREVTVDLLGVLVRNHQIGLYSAHLTVLRVGSRESLRYTPWCPCAC